MAVAGVGNRFTSTGGIGVEHRPGFARFANNFRRRPCGVGAACDL
jgi:hypothetical protein